MKVGVLGSGDVGRVLSAGFAGLGHDVRIGTRDPEKLKDWAASTGGHVSVGTFEEAAQFGDLIILATLGVATTNAIKLAGVQNFALEVGVGYVRQLAGHVVSWSWRLDSSGTYYTK